MHELESSTYLSNKIEFCLFDTFNEVQIPVIDCSNNKTFWGIYESQIDELFGNYYFNSKKIPNIPF